MKKSSLILLIAAMLLPHTVSSQPSNGQRQRQQMSPEQRQQMMRRMGLQYGVHDIDSLRWRDNCILADPASHTYYFVGPAGRSIRQYKSKDLKHWEGPTTIFTVPEGFWGDTRINSIWAPELHYYQL